MRVFASHHTNYLPRLHKSYDYHLHHGKTPRYWYSRPFHPPTINQSTAYLTFSPIFMPSTGIFRVLDYKRSTMPIKQVGNCWMMDPVVLKQWEELVPNLQKTAVTLINHAVQDHSGTFVAELHFMQTPLAQLRNLRTWSWTDNERGKDEAHTQVGFAWKGFFPLFTLISYLIAITANEDSVTPLWVEALRERKVNNVLISTLRSEVADFSGKRPRIGTLLNILEERHNYALFMHCSVPAWFKLTATVHWQLHLPRWGGYKVPSVSEIEQARMNTYILLAAPDLPPPAPPITW